MLALFVLEGISKIAKFLIAPPNPFISTCDIFVGQSLESCPSYMWKCCFNETCSDTFAMIKILKNAFQQTSVCFSFLIEKVKLAGIFTHQFHWEL